MKKKEIIVTMLDGKRIVIPNPDDLIITVGNVRSPIIYKMKVNEIW